MCSNLNYRYKDLKKQKYYSKYRLVSWKILGKLRLQGNLKNQKPKWKFMRHKLLNMKDFWGKRKKMLGLKNHMAKKKRFILKGHMSCFKRSFLASLGETRRIKHFFGLLQTKNLKKLILKYSKSKRLREKLLINHLESRLDVVLYRMGFSSSVLESASLIKKGLVLVNRKKNLKRNFQIEAGDLIELDSRSQKLKKSYFHDISNNQNRIPSYLEVNFKKLRGIFIRKPLKKELMYPEKFCFKTSLRKLEK